MKKNVLLLIVGLVIAVPTRAQSWNKWDTRSTISGVLNVANAAIESAERKKEMEILARQKVEFEQSFQDGRKPLKNMRRLPNSIASMATQTSAASPRKSQDCTSKAVERMTAQASCTTLK